MKNAEEKAREFTEDLARTLKSLVGLAMSIEECQTFVNAVVNETMNEYANQQPEVECSCPKFNGRKAISSICNIHGKDAHLKQPKQGEVEKDKLREAATNIIQKWKGRCAITSSDIQKLEEALNQNGLAMCSADPK